MSTNAPPKTVLPPSQIFHPGYVHARNRATAHQPCIRDLVLLKRNQNNQLDVPFMESITMSCTAIKGSQVTAKRRGVTVTRKCSYFKCFIPYMQDIDDLYFSTGEEERGEMENQRQRDNAVYDIKSAQSDDDIDNAERDQLVRRYQRREN